MLPDNVSKHQWLKLLRGAGLAHGEFRVLVIIFTYTDSNGFHAHPGLVRLAEDAGVTRNTARSALRSATEQGWLKLTRKGGNHVAKGLADEYELAVPKRLQNPKGAVGVPLGKGSTGEPLKSSKSVDNSVEGDDPRGQFEHQGVNPDTPQGFLSGSLKGSVGVPPSDQYIRSNSIPSDALHAAASSRRGDSARPSGSTTAATTWGWPADVDRTPPCLQGYTWDDLQNEFELVEEWLGKWFGLDGFNESTAHGMWESGAHPRAIWNKINADRKAAAA